VKDSAADRRQEEVMYDLKNLSKMNNLEALAPEAMKAEGAIPGKYKERIALGIAFTTQCPYCIEIHSNNARRLGRPIGKLPKSFSSQRHCAPVGRSRRARMR
jgi:AhpD family alkylhydroperoxidase